MFNFYLFLILFVLVKLCLTAGIAINLQVIRACCLLPHAVDVFFESWPRNELDSNFCSFQNFLDHAGKTIKLITVRSTEAASCKSLCWWLKPSLTGLFDSVIKQIIWWNHGLKYLHRYRYRYRPMVFLVSISSISAIVSANIIGVIPCGIPQNLIWYCR